jgi:hypothetical protein
MEGGTLEEGAAGGVAARGWGREKSAQRWAPLRCDSPGGARGGRTATSPRVRRTGRRGGRAARITGGDGGGREPVSVERTVWQRWVLWAMAVRLGWAVTWERTERMAEWGALISALISWLIFWEALGVRRLIWAQKSVVPASFDSDPAGETSCDTVLQFNPSVFVKQTRGPIIRADLC